MLKNNLQRYGLISKLLHWLIALCVMGLIALGWYMVGLDYYDPWYHTAQNWHKSVGCLVFALAIFKCVWWCISPQPSLSSTIAAWQRLAARLVHYILFGVLLLLPLTGYFISTSAGDAISIFGWLSLPAMFSVSESMRDGAIQWHYILAYGTLAVVAFHALAAIKHQFIDKDGTLRKMLW